MEREAGMDMTQELTRACALTPSEMYAMSTEPVSQVST